MLREFVLIAVFFFSPAMGPTPPSLGRVIPSRAVSPMDSRVMVATASQGTLQAMARAPIVLTDRPRTVSLFKWVTPPLPALSESCFS